MGMKAASRQRVLASGLRTARRLVDGQTVRCRVKIGNECVVCVAKFDVEVHRKIGPMDSYATAASIYLSEKNMR